MDKSKFNSMSFDAPGSHFKHLQCLSSKTNPKFVFLSRKVPRKVFAEGFCERFVRGRFPEGFRKDSGRFWAFGPALPHPESFLRKVLRKVFVEGSESAEGFCGRFRRRFPEGFPRKVKTLFLSYKIVCNSEWRCHGNEIA